MSRPPDAASYMPTRIARVRLWLAMATLAVAVGVSALVRFVRAERK